jgi:hypothetical protein
VANQFLNNQVYSNTFMLLLKNEMAYGKLVDGQFSDQVTNENGLTINVKRPPRFVDKKDGTANLALQDIVTGTSPVTADQYSKVHISVGDIEYVQSFNELLKNASMKAAAARMAQTIDSYIAGKTLLFNSWVAGGSPATGSANATDPTKAISSFSQAMGAHTRLMSQGTPNADLCGVLNFDDGERIRGSLAAAFLPPNANMTALERARLPVLSEVDWYASQNTPSITTGTRIQGDGSTTGFQIQTANQNVSYRNVKGAPASAGMTQTLNLAGASQAGLTVNQGEVFTIQNVFSWDWRAQQKNNYLQQFTIVSGGSGQTAAAGTGQLTVTISPAIIVQGTTDGVSTDTNTAFATVDSVPALNAFVQFVGAPSVTTRVKAAWHKRAISLVSARLFKPFTGESSYAVDPETGIAIRYWRMSDVTTGNHVHRWDCLFGATVLDSYLGTRVAGS